MNGRQGDIDRQKLRSTLPMQCTGTKNGESTFKYCRALVGGVLLGKSSSINSEMSESDIKLLRRTNSSQISTSLY